MATRIPVSPDADGVVRINCGGVELELEIVSPDASSGIRPVPTVPPRDRTKDRYVSYQLEPGLPHDPVRQGYLGVATEKLGVKLFPNFDRVVGAGPQFDMVEYDLTDPAGTLGLGDVAAEVARLTPPLHGPGFVHLQANRLDIHGVEAAVRRLHGTLGAAAPTLFVDLKTLRND